MNDYFKNVILKATGAEDLYEICVIQNLWSGYGQIVRYGLTGSNLESVVVKHVRLPDRNHHPRGWNTDLGHERKIRSYEVETAWYTHWSSRCDEACRIPHCLAFETQGEEVLMVLEDLDSAGFPARRTYVTEAEIEGCLSWLANFHATFMGEQPTHLWPIGTYWHLDTRPEELRDLEDQALKTSAKTIDNILNNSPFQTFVHGDAKLANFCFSPDGSRVAAVDFQYVGGGCGMKDVAYFIGSCLDETESEHHEAWLLDHYFNELKIAIKKHSKPVDVKSLEANWRELFPVAWTDFHRFLKGWSPGHWKLNSYSERLASQVLAELNQ